MCGNPYKDIFKITYNTSENCVTLERKDIKSGWDYKHHAYIKSTTLSKNDNTIENNNFFDIDALKVYNISKKTRIGKHGDGGYCILLQNSYIHFYFNSFFIFFNFVC